MHIKNTCAAKTFKGGKCPLPAGHQTIHKGVGRCRFHERTDPLYPFKYAGKKIQNGFGMCRSPLELKAFQMLDRNRYVEKYSIEPFAVEYIFAGEVKKYLPDILVTYKNGMKEIIEIKVKNESKLENNIKKYEAAERDAKKIGALFKIWLYEYRPLKRVKIISNLAELD